jgi:hypothetical protein
MNSLSHISLQRSQFIVLAIVAKPQDHWKQEQNSSISSSAGTANSLKPVAASATSAANPAVTTSVASSNPPAFLHRLPIFRQAKFVNLLLLRACCRIKSYPVSSQASQASATGVGSGGAGVAVSNEHHHSSASAMHTN